jgi:hypothetical protein
MAISYIRITLRKADLLKLPEAEQKLFLISGHIANEIALLHRLLLGCLNYAPKSEAGMWASAVQSMTVSKLLAGKLHEAWEAVRKYYFSGPSQVYGNLLPPEAKEAEKHLSRYFGKQNPISRMRNEAAFHYSCERPKQAIAELTDTEPLNLFIAEQTGNSLFHCCEVLLQEQLFPARQQIGLSNEFKTFVDDSARIARMFSAFLQGCVFVAITERMKIEVQPETDSVPQADTRAINDLIIPYFIDGT